MCETRKKLAALRRAEKNATADPAHRVRAGSAGVGHGSARTGSRRRPCTRCSPTERGARILLTAHAGPGVAYRDPLRCITDGGARQRTRGWIELDERPAATTAIGERARPGRAIAAPLFGYSRPAPTADFRHASSCGMRRAPGHIIPHPQSGAARRCTDGDEVCAASPRAGEMTPPRRPSPDAKPSPGPRAPGRSRPATPSSWSIGTPQPNR